MIPPDSKNSATPYCLTAQKPRTSQDSFAKESLYQSEGNLKPSSTVVPGLIYQLLLHENGSIACPFMSPSCREFLEVEAAEIESHPARLIEMIHSDDWQSFNDSMALSVQTLQPWRWEGRFILPSGKIKWVQCDSHPVVQKNQAILWHGLLVDATSQRRLNEEVERLSFLLGLTERIQTSTNLYEVSQFALNYLIQATDCAFGDVKIINGINGEYQALPLNNYISSEFVASHGEPVVAEMEAALRRGQPYGHGLFWQVVETGKPLFVEDYASHPNAIPEFCHPGIGQIAIYPIPAIDGTIIGVLTLEARNMQRIQELPQQDMLLAACRILGVRIERAQAQERLRSTNENLERTSDQLRQKAHQLEQALVELQQAQMQMVQTEKMSSLGQLVAGVAHEINNPINFIYGNLTHAANYTQDLLSLLHLYQQQYPEPTSEIQDQVEEIDLDFIQADFPNILTSMKVGADRIRQIILSLRNFSRLDEAEMKRVDLHEGLDNTLLLLQHRLNEKIGHSKIEVTKDYGELPLVHCYAGQLNQVFINILSNAIDALEESFLTDRGVQSSDRDSQTTPSIHIRTEVIDSTRIRIAIADNGPGMSEQVQQRLFDPFFTTKPVGQGTGLGMAISYKIVVDRHGGQLYCVSAPSQGTEFRIEIPID